MLSGKMYRFRVDPRSIEPRYLEAFLLSSSAQAAIDAMKTGISDSGLNLTHGRFKELSVIVPPRPEQTRIVDRIDELFTDLDAGVAALTRVRKKLPRYRAALLHAAVTGRLTADWRAKQGDGGESGEALLQRILKARRADWEGRTLTKYRDQGKQPPRDWQKRYDEPRRPQDVVFENLPHHWAIATVGQLSCAVQYGTSTRANSDASGVPVLRMGNLTRDGMLDVQSLRYLPRDHDEFPQLLLAHGDLLFNRTNSADLVGKTAVFEKLEGEWSFASYLIRIRAAQSVVPHWICWCINSPCGRAWAARVLTHTAGQANINGTKLSDFAIPLPPQEEQTAIEQRLSEKLSLLDALEDEIERGLRRSTRLRQSTLKSAFEGRLVPQDLSDEPASALLARIREQTASEPASKARKKPPRRRTANASDNGHMATLTTRSKAKR